MNHSNLINFNVDQVKPNSQGILRFVDEGRLRGECSLRCHNYEHRETRYP
jgi:hypothetical protein